MAQTIRTNIGTGSATVYDVVFDLGYLNRDHIYVYQGTDRNIQLPYTWINDAQVQVNVSAGEEFYIRRIVPRNVKINSFEDGAILRDTNLDASFAQSLMITEEIYDGFLNPDRYLVPANIDMGGYRIQNLGLAIDSTDAVPLAQADTLFSGAPQVPSASVLTLETSGIILEEDNRTILLANIPNLDSFERVTVYLQGVRQVLGYSYATYQDRLVFSEDVSVLARVTILSGVDPIQAPVYTTKTRTFTVATDGQQTFVAPRYVVGHHELLVHIDGVYQMILDNAYSESETTTIQLADGVKAGTKVEITRIQ